MAFPDFLCIGARKSGTTWLHRNLSRHPEIWTPPEKEIHYFDQRIKEPTFGALAAKILGRQYTDDWYHYWFWPLLVQSCLRRHRAKFDPQTALWDYRFFIRSPSDLWYASLFEQGREKITGETTPDYSILQEETIAHVHEIMPDSRIILIMRNPIEQVYSAAVMGLDLNGQGAEGLSDEELFELCEDERGKHHASYLHILERWQRFYPSDQIFIGFTEDIHFYPVRLLRRVYRFLGVDTSYARQAVRHKIHSRTKGKPIRTHIAARLARAFYEDLQHLSARFGGYASFWLYCAEKMIDGAVAEDTIPYPLFESRLWEEWVGKSHLDPRARSSLRGLQSAPLTTLMN